MPRALSKFDAPLAVCGLHFVVAQSDFPTITNQRPPHMHLLPTTPTPQRILSVVFPPPTTNRSASSSPRILPNSKIISRALRPYPIHFRFALSSQSYRVGFNPDTIGNGGDNFAIHGGWNVAGPHQKTWWNATDDGKLYRS